jgi:hypothetical protein
MLLPMQCIATLAAVVAALAAEAQPPATRVFVREETRVVEYDLSTGQAVRTVTLPDDARLPDYSRLAPDRRNGIWINRVGQIAVMLQPEGGQARLWFWDGRVAHVVSRPQPESAASLPDNVGLPAREDLVQAVPSADGVCLYWITDDVRIPRQVKRPYSEVPEIARTVRVQRTNAAGQGSAEIARVAFEPCVCETSGCEETCPEASLRAPETGIDDAFFITSWIPGQLDSTLKATDRWIRRDRSWTRETLPSPVESFLDIADGETCLTRIGDAGCCGWVNSNSDQTVLWRSGQASILFDEWKRFGNSDYDITFWSANARLSPDRARVAHTLDRVFVDETLGRANSSDPAPNIRLAESATKPNPAALARIHREMRPLPAVEVLALDGAVERRIAHRRLIGWRDPDRLVLLAGRSVVIFDTRTGQEYATGIQAEDVHRIWLR